MGIAEAPEEEFDTRGAEDLWHQTAYPEYQFVPPSPPSYILSSGAFSMDPKATLYLGEHFGRFVTHLGETMPSCRRISEERVGQQNLDALAKGRAPGNSVQARR